MKFDVAKHPVFITSCSAVGLETLSPSRKEQSTEPYQTAMADTTQVASRSNQRGYAILCICIACGIIETFAVALRFVARRRMKARLRKDDWFIFASLWPNYAMITTGGFREL